MICTEDYATGEKKCYEFARVNDDLAAIAVLRDEVIAAFDSAPSLCAFNGHRFDIPFIAVSLDIPLPTITAWKKKTTDIFEFCKTKYQHTFSLNKICEANDIPVKISSGLEAVKMAADGRFDALRSYCEYDVSILNILYRKRFVLNPRNNVIMDLAEWTEPYVFPEAKNESPMEKMRMMLDAENSIMQARAEKRKQLPKPAPSKRARLELPDMLEG